MTKKKRVILISTVIVLLMAAIVMLMVYLQQKKAERIQESYCKQNYAFRLGCDKWYTLRNDSDYMSYDAISNDVMFSNENELYALLLLYEHDTGNVVTLENIKDYLLQEYENDGSLRISSSYPQIQGYIDFIWQLYKENEEIDNTYSLAELKDLPKNKLCELEKFIWGLEWVGQDYLPVPYCISFSVKDAHDENMNMGYRFYNLPKEQVKQIVDWIFEIGWMDLPDWEAWQSENPRTIKVGSIDWKESIALGEKPIDSLSDEVWNEWILQYNEFMEKSANK